jgi:hypothetical protein
MPLSLAAAFLAFGGPPAGQVQRGAGMLNFLAGANFR